MARLGTACVLGSRGLVLSGPLAIWIHSTALRGCPQSVLSAVELRGAGRTPSGNVQAAAYRANRRVAGRAPIFSRTINLGPEDSSPQLLFFCCSSVLFEIWRFRQKKGGQSERKREGEVSVKSEQLLEWLLGILCHIPKSFYYSIKVRFWPLHWLSSNLEKHISKFLQRRTTCSSLYLLISSWLLISWGQIKGVLTYQSVNYLKND